MESAFTFAMNCSQQNEVLLNESVFPIVSTLFTPNAYSVYNTRGCRTKCQLFHNQKFFLLTVRIPLQETILILVVLARIFTLPDEHLSDLLFVIRMSLIFCQWRIILLTYISFSWKRWELYCLLL